MSLAPSTALRAALDALADSARSFEFRLPADTAHARQELVDELTSTVDGYLIPRLATLDEGPATVVVLGSTGSGKSTLVNSLAQAAITRPGPVRPTTRRPVAWTHHDNVDALDDLDGLLEVAATRDEFVRELVIIDAPDFDSVVAEHREMVEELTTRADFAVFVTTAQRYADSVPWDVLRGLVARGTPLLTVINRMPAGVFDEVGPGEDFARLLQEQRVSAHPPIVIEEQPVDALHGGLPSAAIEAVSEQLRIVGDTAQAVVMAATRGAVSRTVELANLIREASLAENAELDRLASVVQAAYDGQAAEFETHVRDGSMIRNEVLQRWNEQLGTSQLFSEMGEGLGRLRGWLRSVFGGAAPEVRAEAEAEVAEEVVRRAGIAARQVATAWDLDQAARGLIDEQSWGPAPSTRDIARDEIERWLDRVAGLVRERGEGRQKVARVASYGVNALAVLTLIAVFSQTAGMTGAEVGITAGAAAVQQKLLEYVLGTAAARSLVAEARESLMTAVRTSLSADADRFDLAPLRSGDPESLEGAADAVLSEAGRFYA